MKGRACLRLGVVAVALLVGVGGCGGRNRETILRGSPPPRARTDEYRYVPLEPKARKVPRTGRAEGESSKPSGAAPARETAWQPTAKERPWQWIVIHHSGTDRGCAEAFDDWHRNGRHWDELGYHFVIGNGTTTSDGQIELGSRWVKQKHGAHCKVPDHEEYNQAGIGICLVGNFEKTRPTRAQMEALVRLVDWLSHRYGVPDDHVIGHRDVKDTDCPGRNFSFEGFFKRLHARRAARRAN